MYFDTHTHINFAAYKADQDDVIKRSLNEKTWMINVGTQSDTSRAAVDLAQKYPEGVFAAIGLHPVHTYSQVLDEEESHFLSREEYFDTTLYHSMITDKVVAIGEIGLDYFRLPAENQQAVISKQKTELIKQLEFAKKHGLPVTFHGRDLPATPASGLAWRAGAYEDLIAILKSEYAGQPGVIHSFTGDWPTAKKFLDLGFYVAVNGILIFDKTGRLAEVVEKTPFDKLLIETDSPYLTPPPHRGKRNEPSYVQYVAKRIAEFKNLTTDEVGQQTFDNACSLFQIKKPKV